MARVTGHLALRQRKRGPVYYLRYRLADGRHVQRLLGPAWTERSRPPAGYFTKKMAEDELRKVLTDAERGILPGSVPASGHTFQAACEAWLHYVEHDRQRSPSTLADYRNVVRASLLTEFGKDTPIEDITTERIDAYRERLLAEAKVSRRTAQKTLVLLSGVLKRAKRRGWIASNPAEDVERIVVKRSGDFNVLTPPEVMAVARAAPDPQLAAVITVAAFSGLRLGELRALRWRDVDFARQTIFVRGSFTHGRLGKPKSGKVRSVPLIDQAAAALDGLSRRDLFTDPDDLVFCSPVGRPAGDHHLRDGFYEALTSAGLADKRSGADPIVFHDLRHTFGTLAVEVWPLHDVQGYMGHADIQTTMIYVHHQPKAIAANQLSQLVAAAVSPTMTRTAENGTQLSATDDAR